MELTWLRSFLSLAREGNMTRAAASLHLTQPALSAQLAHLEQELGQPLFDRGARGMTLTAAGRALRPYVEEALGRLEDGQTALDQLQGLERGALALGGGATATTYLLPRLLGRFHARHPAIRLFVREQGSLAVAESVLAGELDLGVVTLPIPLPAAKLSQLHVERWVVDELLLIVPPGHPLEGRATFRWPDLRGAPLVLFEAGTAVRALIDKSLAAAGIEVEIVMELRSIESIKQLVAQGVGAAFVSSFALDGPRAGLRCRDGALQRELALIHRAGRRRSPAAQAFLQLLRLEVPRTARGGRATRGRKDA